MSLFLKNPGEIHIPKNVSSKFIDYEIIVNFDHHIILFHDKWALLLIFDATKHMNKHLVEEDLSLFLLYSFICASYLIFASAARLFHFCEKNNTEKKILVYSSHEKRKWE